MQMACAALETHSRPRSVYHSLQPRAPPHSHPTPKQVGRPGSRLFDGIWACLGKGRAAGGVTEGDGGGGKRLSRRSKAHAATMMPQHTRRAENSPAFRVAWRHAQHEPSRAHDPQAQSYYPAHGPQSSRSSPMQCCKLNLPPRRKHGPAALHAQAASDVLQPLVPCCRRSCLLAPAHCRPRPPASSAWPHAGGR